MNSYDVMVIGAGAVGSAVARELSRYQLKTAVLEKELDVAAGNSGRNSGVVHAGFTYKVGSLKAECAVEGNREFDKVAEELDVPFRRTGKLVVGFTEQDMKHILKYKAIGEQNGVQGLEIIDKERMKEIDPSAGGEFAMYSPMSGILDPIQYNIALAENACENGVEFLFGEKVVSIERKDGIYKIDTECQNGINRPEPHHYETRWVINCAGMYASEISEMLGFPYYPVKGFKGEYFVLDKKAGQKLSVPVYPAPNEKGGFATHATITIDGNVLIGPDSYVTEDREDYGVTKEHLDGLVVDGSKMFDQIKREYYIRNFAGIRWKRYDPETGEILDFLLESDDDHPGAVNLVGIESPGLTSALPLARRAVKRLLEKENAAPNPNFNPRRKGIRRFSEMNHEEQKKAVEENPDYGEIICRCESVTRAEILQAIHNPLGVHTVTGIKNRTRATMGRCQGGYCETRITGLIEKELGIPETDVRYSKANSYMFTGKVR